MKTNVLHEQISGYLSEHVIFMWEICGFLSENCNFEARPTFLTHEWRRCCLFLFRTFTGLVFETAVHNLVQVETHVKLSTCHSCWFTISELQHRPVYNIYKTVYQGAIIQLENQLLLRMSRSYDVVWNSPAVCWRWLFHRGNFYGLCLFAIIMVYFKFIHQTAPTSMVKEVGSLRRQGRRRGWKL